MIYRGIGDDTGNSWSLQGQCPQGTERGWGRGAQSLRGMQTSTGAMLP